MPAAPADYSALLGSHPRGDGYLRFCFAGLADFLVTPDLLLQVTPAPVSRGMAAWLGPRRLLVPFSGTGMDALSLALAGSDIACSDRDELAVTCTRANLRRHLGGRAVPCRCADVWEALEGDAAGRDVYLDPPWGSPHHAAVAQASLEPIWTACGGDVLAACLARGRAVALKLPPDVAGAELARYGRDLRRLEIRWSGRPLMLFAAIALDVPERTMSFEPEEPT
jgi:hypothetical protein